jgi:murein DD-endopeptidase MepM/ murein hydrolase activator NlpD
MTAVWDRRVRTGCALLACVCAGALGDGLLRMKYVRNEPGVRDVATAPAMRLKPDTKSHETPDAKPDATPAARTLTIGPVAPVVSAPGGAVIAAPTGTAGAMSATPLRVPIEGASVESFKGGFEERRGGRPHEAVDILAPRNTPIVAVEDGTIAKLFNSKAGGLTIYQYDPTGRLAYYYAHLERYADGLREGQPVAQGSVIGYVGTSGNAPPDTPHLHFAVFELDGDRRWWKGKAIDPYLVFKPRG